VSTYCCPNNDHASHISAGCALRRSCCCCPACTSVTAAQLTAWDICTCQLRCQWFCCRISTVYAAALWCCCVWVRLPQELLLLLPDLASLLPSLHPKTLALLGSDTQGVAQKLVRCFACVSLVLGGCAAAALGALQQGGGCWKETGTTERARCLGRCGS
jgi:hypothetical protein